MMPRLWVLALLVTVATSAAETAEPTTTPETVEELREQTTALEELCNDECDDEELHEYLRLMLRLGEAYKERAIAEPDRKAGDAEEDTDANNAIKAVQHAAAMSFEHFGVSSDLHVEAIDVLGNMYIEAGRPGQAVQFFAGRAAALKKEEEEHHAVSEDGQAKIAKHLRGKRAAALIRLGQVTLLAKDVGGSIRALEESLALVEAETELMGAQEASALRAQLSRALVAKNDTAVLPRAVEVAQTAVADAAGLASADNSYAPAIEMPIALRALASALEASGDREGALGKLQQAARLIVQVPGIDKDAIKAFEADLSALVERDLRENQGAASRSILQNMEGEEKGGGDAKEEL